MNYLAHFHLSHGNEGLMIGALLGDVIKGPLKGQFPRDWEQGIILHRKIDAYTDQHPAIKNCCAQFPTEFRRYGGIVVDVAFDHFLNKHWRQLQQESLEEFTQQTYQLLKRTSWPAAAKPHATRIVQHDLLNNYQHRGFIIDVLASISRRLRHDNPLAKTDALFEQHYESIEQCFLKFYPQLQDFAQQTRVQLK